MVKNRNKDVNQASQNYIESKYQLSYSPEAVNVLLFQHTKIKQRDRRDVPEKAC